MARLLFCITVTNTHVHFHYVSLVKWETFFHTKKYYQVAHSVYFMAAKKRRKIQKTKCVEACLNIWCIWVLVWFNGSYIGSFVPLYPTTADKSITRNHFRRRKFSIASIMEAILIQQFTHNQIIFLYLFLCKRKIKNKQRPTTSYFFLAILFSRKMWHNETISLFFINFCFFCFFFHFVVHLINLISLSREKLVSDPKWAFAVATCVSF